MSVLELCPENHCSGHKQYNNDTPYTGADWILLLIKWKLTIGKVETDCHRV